MEQRGNDDNLLPHPFREILKNFILVCFGEAKELKEFVLPRLRNGSIQMSKLTHQIEIFARAHRFVQDRMFGNVSEMLFDLHRILIERKPCDAGMTRSLANKSGKNFYGRGFSRTVRTEQSENLTTLDNNAEVI